MDKKIPSRFTDEDTLVARTPCVTCVHRFADPARCRAFPAGIPSEIRSGANDHREPFPGDNGVTYERRK